jgi:soluble lytic murein transglycosylase-like protein
MRQLFLPACVCLVTWSGATNSDLRFNLDELTGTHSSKRSIAAPARAEIKPAGIGREADALISNEQIAALSPDDFAPRDVETPAAENADASAETKAPELSDQEIAAVLADLAIEPPVPSGEVINDGIPAGIPLPPIAKPVIARTEEEVCGTLTEAAQRNGLPAPFFIRLLFQESRFKPGVVSSAGAQGIAQFMPDTAADMGLDNPFDPLQAIPASARLLRGLFEKFGNLGLAAAAYNAGPKRIADWLADRRKNKLPEETQGYVKTITGKPVENWSAAAARHPGIKLPRRAPCQEAAGLLAWNGPDAVPLPAPAPLRVAALVAAEKSKAEKLKAEADKKKTPAKTAGKPKETPKAATQMAAHKREHKHKPERIAQR